MTIICRTIVLATTIFSASVILPGTAVFPATVAACTVVRYQIAEGCLVARNHDWMFGEGLVIVEPRGLTRDSLTPVRPHRWTSRFGSVSFTQFGRGIPFAGMNEAGLTVDLLQLPNAKFPTAPSHDRDTVNVIQWVQFQLDTSATVDDVVDSLDRVVPLPLIPSIERVHYFVTDASGDVAIIEFVSGKLIVKRGPQENHCALANTDIQTSIQRFTANDRSRYGIAVRSIAGMKTTLPKAEATDRSFAVLAKLHQHGLTQWGLVYVPRLRRVEFVSTKSPNRRWIDLDDFDLSSGSATLAIDVLTNETENLHHHCRPITPAANARIVQNAFDQYLPPGLGRIAVKQLVLNHFADTKHDTNIKATENDASPSP